MERNKVVLVDEKDNAIGVMDKMLAHELGKLHRAFSIFIFNDKGEMLLQQRALHKYHGGGLWTNTCCSHPQWEEDVILSAHERLEFEMGLSAHLTYVYAFVYNEEVENNLIEHEYDHVFVGYTNTQPVINEDEVMAYKWVTPMDVLSALELDPQLFTVWFRKAFPVLMEKILLEKFDDEIILV